MYCPNCGKEIPEDSEFCLSCGTAIASPQPQSVNRTASFQPPVPDYGIPATASGVVNPVKKSFKPRYKLLIGIIAACAVIISLVCITIWAVSTRDNYALASQESYYSNEPFVPYNGAFSSFDYIASLKAFDPFSDYGVSATYGDVINKYLNSPKWNYRVKSSTTVYVDVSGTMKDTDGTMIDISITYVLSPYEGKSSGDYLRLEPYSMEIGGTKAYDSISTDAFITDMFDAYDRGYTSMASYYNNNTGSFM